MSSTGFGSDWTAGTPWTTAAGSGATGCLWVHTEPKRPLVSTETHQKRLKCSVALCLCLSWRTRTSGGTTTTSVSVRLQTWAPWPGWPCTVTPTWTGSARFPEVQLSWTFFFYLLKGNSREVLFLLKLLFIKSENNSKRVLTVFLKYY